MINTTFKPSLQTSIQSTKIIPRTEPTLAADSPEINTDEVKIGTRAYDGEKVAITKKAPFSHKVIAAIGAAGAIGCAAKVGAHVCLTSTIIPGGRQLKLPVFSPVFS